MNKITQLVQI